MSEAIVAQFKLAWPSFALDVDLTLPARGVTVLFGHSGSGKSTVLRCMAGLEQAQGYLKVQGEVWQDSQYCMPTHQRRLGYVFQEANLFSHLTVQQNLRYGWKRRGRAEHLIDFESAIGLLGIEPLLARKPSKLSGGERQRVAIARALLSDPHILLMDEPLASLDGARKREIMPFLQKLHDKLSIPIVYVTHSPEEVGRLADYLVVLEQGRVMAQGSLSDVLARVDVPVYAGDEAGVVLQGVVVQRDQEFALALVRINGFELWVKDVGIALGAPIRLRILARDVSVSLEVVQHSSILNTVSGVITQLVNEEHPAVQRVQIQIGSHYLWSRLTRRSVQNMGLTVGSRVWGQIKSVAIIE